MTRLESLRYLRSLALAAESAALDLHDLTAATEASNAISEIDRLADETREALTHSYLNARARRPNQGA